MNRCALPIALVAAAMLALTGCSGDAPDPEAAASASASSKSAAEARRLAENSAAAASSSSAAASSAAAAASASAAAEAARISDPTVFTGSGDSVVAITKPARATVVLATITGNDASSYFGVKAVDGDQDTLVNTTEPYTGTTLMDARVGGTTQLQVTATGPWSITLSDPRSAPTLSQGSPYAGTGDAVIIYQGSRGIASITGNAGGSYFGVKVYSSSSSGGAVVNTTDPYTGSVPWPVGPAIVVVTSEDDWTISVA